MKTTHLILTLAIALLVGASQSPATRSVESSTTAPGTHERAALKVLKAFSAKDGEAIFRAYLVSWKGQEVVADDPLAKTDYHVGDTVDVLVMKLPFPKGKEKYGLLSFQIVPKVR